MQCEEEKLGSSHSFVGEELSVHSSFEVQVKGKTTNQHPKSKANQGLPSAKKVSNLNQITSLSQLKKIKQEQVIEERFCEKRRGMKRPSIEEDLADLTNHM